MLFKELSSGAKLFGEIKKLKDSANRNQKVFCYIHRCLKQEKEGERYEIYKHSGLDGCCSRGAASGRLHQQSGTDELSDQSGKRGS